MLAVPPRQVAAVLHWWRNRSAPEARPRAAGHRSGAAGPPTQNVVISDPDYQHSKLMVRRMARLGLDPETLSRTERLLFQKLHAACILCPCPELCALALMDESIDCGWQQWRDYCPNATELSLLSALNISCSDLDGTQQERTK